MSGPIQDLSNTREVMQHQIMEELAVTGECFLCEEVIRRIAKKYPEVASLPLHGGVYWFVKRNDFKYEGAKLHMLIVPKRHVTALEQLTSLEFSELQEHLSWINSTYAVEGASLFLRYGDMSYTGATGSHLHFQVLHGRKKQDGGEPIKVKLGYS